MACEQQTENLLYILDATTEAIKGYKSTHALQFQLRSLFHLTSNTI